MPVHLPYSSSNFLRVPPATSCVPQRFPIGFPPSTIAVNSLSLLHTFNLGSPLCVPYAIHERSKNCLFPRRLIFYLLSLKYLNIWKRLHLNHRSTCQRAKLDVLQGFGAVVASTVRSVWRPWTRTSSPHSLRTFKQIGAHLTPAPAWKGLNKRKSKRYFLKCQLNHQLETTFNLVLALVVTQQYALVWRQVKWV